MIVENDNERVELERKLPRAHRLRLKWARSGVCFGGGGRLFETNQEWDNRHRVVPDAKRFKDASDYVGAIYGLPDEVLDDSKKMVEKIAKIRGVDTVLYYIRKFGAVTTEQLREHLVSRGHADLAADLEAVDDYRPWTKRVDGRKILDAIDREWAYARFLGDPVEAPWEPKFEFNLWR